MEIIHPGIAYLFVILFSLAIGSLLNVVIYRVPIMLKREWQQECRCLLELPEQKEESNFNLFWPRSKCPKCGSMVKSYDNIPILSYLILGGKCRTCKTKISIQYPLIELATCLLSVFTVWHFGFTYTTLFPLFFIWLIIPIAIIDFHEQIIPDSLSYCLLWLGLFANSFNLFCSLEVAVFSAAAGWLFLWGFIQLYKLLTGKIGMGHGDFKLFAALGAWFGWTQMPLILLFASFSGAIIGVLYLKLSRQSQQTPIPFGPFLCVAGVICLYWGTSIVEAYLDYAF